MTQEQTITKMAALIQNITQDNVTTVELIANQAQLIVRLSRTMKWLTVSIILLGINVLVLGING